jgi:hypothetical protein
MGRFSAPPLKSGSCGSKKSVLMGQGSQAALGPGQKYRKQPHAKVQAAGMEASKAG